MAECEGAGGSPHFLDVHVIEGKELKITNFFSSSASDSFVTLSTRDKLQKLQTSEVQLKTLTPQWGQTFTFNLPQNPDSETLFITVWGKKAIKSDVHIGRLEVPVSLVLQHAGEGEKGYKQNTPLERWFLLLPQEGTKDLNAPTGWIKLGFTYKFIPLVLDVMPGSSMSAIDPYISIGMAGMHKSEEVTAIVCSTCQMPYTAEEMSAHVRACSVVALAIHSPPLYPQLSPSFSPRVAALQKSDFSVPEGFSSDPSQPSPNSPRVYSISPSPVSQQEGASLYSSSPQRDFFGEVTSLRRDSLPEPVSDPYAAPQYTFAFPQ